TTPLVVRCSTDTTEPRKTLYGQLSFSLRWRPECLREPEKGLSGASVVLAFGEYRLDIEGRELRRGSELGAVEPKVFDLLAFLVQQRHRVVSKDDLLQAVWGGRIISESALTTRINAARRVVGDDGASQRLIRTFSRKGIRFVGEVVEIPAQAVADK